MRAIVFVLLLFTGKAQADLNSVDLLWKARALQANEKMNQLSKKKTKSQSDKCAEYFETGFSEHADSKVSSKLKRDVEGYRHYTLRFTTPVDPSFSETKDAFVMTTLVTEYDKSGRLTMTSISQLAKGWSTTFMKDSDWIFLNDHKCQFVIFPFDPLKSHSREKK